MPLTFVQCEKTKPEESQKHLPDGNGLYLTIFPSGKKMWCFRYRFEGKQKRLWLGTFPDIGIAHARSLRDSAKLVLNDGIDPADVELDAEGPISFEKVGREWFEIQRPAWSPAHARRVKSRIENDLFGAFGKRPIVSITRKEVLAAIRAVEDRGAIDMAKRVYQYATQIFTFALNEEYIESNPAVGLTSNLKRRPPTQHHARLKVHELPEFFERVNRYDGELTRIGLKLIAHTFVRTRELVGARRSELDFDAGMWRIPGERMKNRLDHIVPLTPTTTSLFRRLDDMAGGKDVLLEISQNTMIFAMYRMGYHTKATVHGFRGTASTILNESGLWRSDAVERQLAHVEQNEVRSAYNAAEYIGERREMMAWYSEFLDDCEKRVSADDPLAELIG